MVLIFRFFLLAALVVGTFVSLGDKLVSGQDPVAFQAEIHRLRHLKSDEAKALAEKGFKSQNQFSAAWRWRFRMLHAVLLLDNVETPEAANEVRTLQNLEVPAGITPQETAARRAALQGYLLYRREKSRDAEKFFDVAVRNISAITQDPCWEAELWVQQRGQNLRDLQQFSLAEQSAARGTNPARSCQDKAWETLIPFLRGNCFNDQFRFEEGLEQFQACLRLSHADGLTRLDGNSLGNMGLCYLNLADTDNALKKFDETDAYYLSLGDKITTLERQVWGGHIEHHARTYFLLKKYPDASKEYEKAIKIADETNDVNFSILGRTELSMLYTETSDYQRAQLLQQEALKRTTSDISLYVRKRVQLNQARLNRLSNRPGEAEQGLNSLQNDPANKKDAEIQWQVHVEKAQLFTTEKRNQEADREFRTALRTADGARSAIRAADYRLTYFLQLKGIYEKYVQFLIDHNQPNEALRVAEAGHARMLAEKLNRSALPSPTVDFLKIARAKNSVILSYSITPKDCHMWITTGEATHMFALPAGTFERVERLIAVHNERIRDQQQPIQGDQGGPQLYNLLVAPVAQWIPLKSNVIIIPDGSLSSLNFETLIPPGNKPHYWIEDVTITVSPSLAQLTTESQPKRDPASILLVGDVVPTSQEKLPPLSPEDVDYLNKLYPASDVLKKGDATPTSFLKKAKTRPYSWIYVSAHAISNPQSPLDSYVVLSPEAKSGDYKLSARDVAELGLRATLVTLSACQSAGAKNIPGEGLVGLSWAVLSAGARNVVASLWPVEVGSTSKLMKKFYSHLHEHEPPDQALHEAKLEMARERNLPYTWAAFQLYSR